jgi:hypothetical protein
MLGRKRRDEEIAAEARAEERRAMAATETDDSSIDPDESLEADEEP